jgi:hypothetical protein
VIAALGQTLVHRLHETHCVAETRYDHTGLRLANLNKTLNGHKALCHTAEGRNRVTTSEMAVMIGKTGIFFPVNRLPTIMLATAATKTITGMAKVNVQDGNAVRCKPIFFDIAWTGLIKVPIGQA